MKKLTVAALAVTTLLSGSAFAHEAGEFFMRAGSATVRPTEGAGGTLGSLGGFSVTNNTQLGLTFTYMATDNIGVELLAATPFRHKIGTRATGDIATVHHLPPTLMAQWYLVMPAANSVLTLGPVLTTPPSLIMDLTIMAKRQGFPISV